MSANYEKPASQVDLENRQSKDYVSPAKLVQGVDPQASENGYVNVDPIYQNFANETEKPFVATEGVESEVEKDYYSEDVDTNLGAAGGPSEDEEDDEEEEEPSGSTTPGPFVNRPLN